MGSSVKKALKSTFKKILIVVAVVVMVAVALVCFAPAALGAVGVSVGAGFAGGVAAVGSTVLSVALSTQALIGFGISAYMAYAADVEAAEAKQDIDNELIAAKAEGKEHFLDMEEDRYENYDGPAIGMTWDRETEKAFLDDGDADGQTSMSLAKILIPSALIAGMVVYG